MERIYKTMRNTGAASIAVPEPDKARRKPGPASIAVGIVVASVGLAAGIIAIINGALLLKRKSEITF